METSISHRLPLMGVSKIERYVLVELNPTTIGSMKLRVLANGKCCTGFAPDVFGRASSEEVREGLACLGEDWLIFERLDSPELKASCVPVERETTQLEVLTWRPEIDGRSQQTHVQ